MTRLQSLLLVAVGFLCAIMAGCAGKAPANGPGALLIAQFTLADGAIGVPYRQLLVASGGQTPYTWSISAGSLPPGLTVTSDGIISGTPTTVGAYNFTVQVTDSQTPTEAVDTAPLSITINQDLTLTASSLPNGIVGSAYNTTLTAANGVPPYTYSLAFGSLPDGLSLMTVQSMNGMANAAAITGTPTTAGTYSFTIQATDSASETATAIFTITVAGRLQGPYAVTFNGFDTSQPAGSQAFYMVAHLTAANDVNGSGTISGVIDQNGPGANIATDVMVTGTYSIPIGMNFGTISFTRADNNATYQFNIALSGTTSDSKLILVDPNHQKWGSGLLKQQPTSSALPGGVSYTFGLFGTDASGDRYAGAGAFALNSSLAVTGGAEDTNDNGTLSGEQFITAGTFSSPDPTTGRGTATLTVGSTTYNFIYYVASTAELVAVENDPNGPMTLVDLLQQQSAGVSGGLVLCKQGSMCQGVLELDGIGTSGSSSVPEVELGVASLSGCTGSPCAGTFTRSDNIAPYYLDQSVGGTVGTVTYSSGTYSIDATCGSGFPSPCGRVTLDLQGPTNQPVWYLISTGEAFVVGGDADVLQGSLQPQSPPTGGFGLPSILGSYLGGTLTPVLPSVTNELDVTQTPPPGGIWAQMYETSGPGGIQPPTGQPPLMFSGSYALDPTLGAGLGRFAICAPMTTEYCTGNDAFMFDPNNPPQSILYIVGGTTAGVTGGKTGLAGLNTGVVQSNGTATLDPNPRLTTLGR